MKKIFIAIILCISSGFCNAQFAYTFSKDTATYVELNAAQLVNGTWSNPFSYTYTDLIEVNFFNIATEYGNFAINGRGEVQFRSYFTAEYFYISGYGVSLVGYHNGTIGEVRYKMEGTYPNKILKVQYKDVGFYNESVGHPSYANFQIWIYENGDKVELRYGTSSISAGLGNVCKAGIYEVETNTINTINAVEASGPATNPVLIAGNHNLGSSLSGAPAPNTVYRFTPNPTSVQNVWNENVKAFYRESNQTVYLKNISNPGSTTLFNSLGQKLSVNIVTDNGGYAISVNDLPAGIYMVRIVEEGKMKTWKFMKK